MALAGRMGWSEQQFFRSSLRYFFAALAGHRRNEQEAWERARWQSWLSLMPYLEKGANLELHDLARFPWEPEPAPRFVLDEATLAWLEKFSEEADIIHDRMVAEQQAAANNAN